MDIYKGLIIFRETSMKKSTLFPWAWTQVFKVDPHFSNAYLPNHFSFSKKLFRHKRQVKKIMELSLKKLSPCIYPLYYKNNLPSFGFRMIRLLVYYVQYKNRNFGYSAWIYIFYWKFKWDWNYLHITYVQFFWIVIFSLEFLEL